MNRFEIKRKTLETDIHIVIDFDKKYEATIITEIGFINHMLNTFAKYLDVSFYIKATGDLNIDNHHLIEDIAIVLGQIINKKINEDKNIKRFGNTIMPMDDSLILVALDLSGRSFLNYDVNIVSNTVGNIETEMFKEMFLKFTNNAKMNLHIKMLNGENGHHIIENIFKALAVSLKQAFIKNDSILSTKGSLGE
ncbi:MAG: imidazoleglycerol-phosphate dehydratase HisB [Bacillota bacterium]|nr:imidazoleglycerol-phosphate dehydratase HisB [Bacillota bacterium]